MNMIRPDVSQFFVKSPDNSVLFLNIFALSQRSDPDWLFLLVIAFYVISEPSGKFSLFPFQTFFKLSCSFRFVDVFIKLSV